MEFKKYDDPEEFVEENEKFILETFKFPHS